MHARPPSHAEGRHSAEMPVWGRSTACPHARTAALARGRLRSGPAYGPSFTCWASSDVALQIEGLPTIVLIPADASKAALRTEGLLPADRILQIYNEHM